MNPIRSHRLLMPFALAPAILAVTFAIFIALDRPAIAQTPPPTLPAMPTGLTVSSVTHNAVTIGWADPQDESITGYQILRRSRDGDTYGDGMGTREFMVIEEDTGTADTKFTDTTVEAGTKYIYQVRARNSVGIGEGSRNADAETQGSPAQPTRLTMVSPVLNAFAIK